MNLVKSKKILIVIVVIAAFLRFWQLGQNPPSLTWDEAAWGYNAYSLGIDGRDEFGRFLPFNYLESFGDFKPPLYAYLDIIPVKLFGLTEFATRFPSALFGVLTVLITYFLTKKIFWNSKQRESYGIFSALFLAISPWHIMLSRAAFEANIATFLLATGIWLFLKGIQEKKYYIVISIVFFVLSMYTFNTSRIVAPLLVLFLGFIFRKNLIENKRQTFMAIMLGILLILPIFGFLFSPQARLRFKEVNIFSDIEIIKTSNQEIMNDNSVWSRITNNRRVGYALAYIKHYFDNFNPTFLFIKGDGNPKFSTQNVGQLYLWDLPFLIGGILLLIRKKEGYWWVVPIWLIIGIIPAATARETPHALRIEATLPTFQILVAYGFSQFLLYLKKYENFFKPMVVFVGLLLFANLFYYLRNYYVHYSYEFSGEWQYGYKDSIEYVKSIEANFDNIYITNAMGRPYVYYLFYTKTDPRIFRKDSDVKRNTFGFVTVDRFGKYNFLNGATRINNKIGIRNLFIQTPNNIPKKINILKTFNLLNDNVALVVYE
ncbi:MAG: glycosyltransferase family 39 protein [Candidatus Parcubacteria bacterium]|nr:glycosyltransferase family 39 protein [Candidatus Parcubacteria bacterium]